MQGNFNHAGLTSAVKDQNVSLFTWSTAAQKVQPSQKAVGNQLNFVPTNYNTVKLAKVQGSYQASQPTMSMTGLAAVNNGQKLHRSSHASMMMNQPTMGRSTLQIKQPTGMMGLTQLPPNQYMRHNFSAAQNIP